MKVQWQVTSTPVIDVMLKEVPLVRPEQWLEAGLRLMQERQIPYLGVVDGSERLIGYISQENIAELMMLEAADWHRGGTVPARPTGTGPF